MSKSKIEWTDYTFNPWEGCTKVGPGCDHCYAEARNQRFAKGENWGTGAPRRRTSAANWKQPLKWNREAEKEGVRYRVFCASLADVFDNEVDPRWRADLFRLIRNTPNLDWLLLTKRIGNAESMIRDALIKGHLLTSGSTPWPWPHVWLGATIVNQEEADRDIPKLLKTPAAIRFISAEPLLGSINLSHLSVPDDADRHDGPWMLTWDALGGFRATSPYSGTDGNSTLDWVIVGGESGPNARPCDVSDIRSIVLQCKAAGVPVFVKQLGRNVIDRNDAGFEGDDGDDWPGPVEVEDVGPCSWQGEPVRVKLQDRKGGDMTEWPEDLRAQEFPNEERL